MAQGDVTRTLVLFRGSTVYLELIYKFPGEPGRRFEKKKELAYRMCARRKATDQRDAQTISLQLHGGDVTCFDVTKLLAGCDEVMWLVVS